MNERIKDTPQRRARRRRRRIIRASLVIFLILFFATAFVLAFRIPQIMISTITVEGNASTPTDDIVAVVNKDLDSNYYLVFPKRNILLYPNAQISADIQSSLKDIETVLVRADSLSSLHIIVKERKPYELWCDGITTCYFLDDSGYIFSLAPQFSGDVYTKYYGGLSPTDPIDKNFLSPAEFAQVDAFVKQASSLGINAAAITSLGNNEYRIDIKGNGYILFSTNAEDNTLSDQLENLSTLIDQAENGSVGKTLPQYEYIDLRFSQKVIYKLLGAGGDASSTPTTNAGTGSSTASTSISH